MAREEVLRVSALMPENRKIIEAGGDAAWLYFCSMAFAKRNKTDGVIPEAAVGRLSDRKQPARLARILLSKDLWHAPGHSCDRCPQPLPGNYVVHDYTPWQGSVQAQRLTKTAKSAGGSYGNHQRWHLSRGVRDPECPHCAAAASHMRSGNPSDERSDSDRICDRLSDPTTDRICESLPDGADQSDGLFPEDKYPPYIPPTAEAMQPGNPPSLHGKTGPRTRRQAYDYADDQDFQRFWAAFPKKAGKPAAFKAWLAALARGADAELVITAAKAYADDPRRNPDHTKYPQGWLNDERYLDEKQGENGGSSSGRHYEF